MMIKHHVLHFLILFETISNGSRSGPVEAHVLQYASFPCTRLKHITGMPVSNQTAWMVEDGL